MGSYYTGTQQNLPSSYLINPLRYLLFLRVLAYQYDINPLPEYLTPFLQLYCGLGRLMCSSLTKIFLVTHGIVYHSAPAMAGWSAAYFIDLVLD